MSRFQTAFSRLWPTLLFLNMVLDNLIFYVPKTMNQIFFSSQMSFSESHGLNKRRNSVLRVNMSTRCLRRLANKKLWFFWHLITKAIYSNSILRIEILSRYVSFAT